MSRALSASTISPATSLPSTNMVNLLTQAFFGTGNRYVASRGRGVLLWKTWVTVVTAAWSWTATSTRWLVMASGGTSLSLGMSRPCADAGAAQGRARKRTEDQRGMRESFRERGGRGRRRVAHRGRGSPEG